MLLDMIISPAASSDWDGIPCYDGTPDDESVRTWVDRTTQKLMIRCENGGLYSTPLILEPSGGGATTYDYEPSDDGGTAPSGEDWLDRTGPSYWSEECDTWAFSWNSGDSMWEATGGWDPCLLTVSGNWATTEIRKMRVSFSASATVGLAFYAFGGSELVSFETVTSGQELELNLTEGLYRMAFTASEAVDVTVDLIEVAL